MASTEREEILAAVRGELGEHGKQIAERMTADAEKIKALDAAVAALKGEVGEKFKGRYQAALAGGTPETMDLGESVDAFLERKLRGESGHGKMSRTQLLAVRQIRALAAAVAVGQQGNAENALAIARGWDDKALAGALEETRDLVRAMHGSDRVEAARAQRALGTVTLGSGASLVAPQYASAIIDVVHPMAVVRSLGATVLPLSTGTLSLPFLSAAVTASYQGESVGPNESSPTDGRLNLARKILTAVVAMSKELLRESSYKVDEFIMMHLARAFAAREDLAFIRGDGTQSTPLGLSYWAGLSSAGGGAHSFVRTLDTVPTVATITSDLIKAIRLVENSNVPMLKCGWILPVRDAWGLISKRNSTTQMEVFPEMRAGNLYGFPFKKSSQIPITLTGDGAGTGTVNKSEVYFADFSSCVIAEQDSLEINAYDGGAYANSSGTVVSGITNREVVIAAAAHHDFGCLFRGAEVAQITSVDWGG